MPSRLPEFDATDLIRITTTAIVDESVFEDGSINWLVATVHDADGHAVGLSVSDRERHYTIEDAHALGSALLIASAAAEAWNRVRGKAN